MSIDPLREAHERLRIVKLFEQQRAIVLQEAEEELKRIDRELRQSKEEYNRWIAIATQKGLLKDASQIPKILA